MKPAIILAVLSTLALPAFARAAPDPAAIAARCETFNHNGWPVADPDDKEAFERMERWHKVCERLTMDQFMGRPAPPSTGNPR